MRPSRYFEDNADIRWPVINVKTDLSWARSRNKRTGWLTDRSIDWLLYLCLQKYHDLVQDLYTSPFFFFFFFFFCCCCCYFCWRSISLGYRLDRRYIMPLCLSGCCGLWLENRKKIQARCHLANEINTRDEPIVLWDDIFRFRQVPCPTQPGTVVSSPVKNILHDDGNVWT